MTNLQREIIEGFAKTILDLLGNERDEWFRGNGLTGDSIDVRFSHSFPKWQLSSFGHSVYEIEKQASSVVNFSDDGLSPNDGIFVVATTNKPGILDQAITSRPARFDVKIKFELPTYEERMKMYKLFLESRKGINYEKLARRSTGMTGAYIKETCVRGIL